VRAEAVCDDGECDGEGRERRGGAARFRFAFSGWHRWEGMPQIFVGDWRLLPLYYLIGLDRIGSEEEIAGLEEEITVAGKSRSQVGMKREHKYSKLTLFVFYIMNRFLT
jgi:hypothetical protein